MKKSVPTFTGFAELRDCHGLFMKLQHDLARMSNDQSDEYAAFDFFVTAEHMVDWHLPNDNAAQRKLRASETLLQITSHIANGAKHFSVTDARHKSVLSVSMEAYAESGYAESGYFADAIEVALSQEEAQALGAPKLEAIVLADRVYEYWRAKLGE